ncbi:MAG TPA: hypothetical protein VFL60_08025, partial [Gaiellaceae bacterium]|nr:hypothetical protein [Gaiellaceae bacterium]
MRLRLLCAAAAGLAFASSAATAAPADRLHLSGRVTADMWPWARAASANVPLPSARLEIRNG